MRITKSAATDYGKKRWEVSMDTFDVEQLLSQRMPGVILSRDLTHIETRTLLDAMVSSELIRQLDTSYYLADAATLRASGRTAERMGVPAGPSVSDILRAIAERLTDEGFVGVEVDPDKGRSFIEKLNRYAKERHEKVEGAL